MAKQVELQNSAGHPIWLPGPNGEKVMFTKFERKMMDEWYVRYSPRYLRVVRHQPMVQQFSSRPRVLQSPKPAGNYSPVRQSPVRQGPVAHQARPSHKVVGQVGLQAKQATQYLGQLISKKDLSISNDIGVGILSYNRLDCLSRLINSIRKFTDLTRTTVFISDESTDPKVLEYLKTIEDMVVLTGERLGVAGNTNRLMRCLDRFHNKILLNDDVEILASNWDQFYFLAMQKTGLHHFCFRQPGVYGARQADARAHEVNGLRLNTVLEKPHGAIMAYDHHAFKTVGCFDEDFGPYGMEHVDWSNRVSLSGIQIPGFHDVNGSESYFKIFPENSATPDRIAYLNQARIRFDSVKDDRSRIHIKPSDRTRVPTVSYVIPYRGSERKSSIRTVVQNIKAQRFPCLDIVAVEQDASTQFTLEEFASITYALAKNASDGQAFTKSMAFNLGAKLAISSKLILHDADMLVYDGYTAQMNQLLDNYDGVHIGANVLYLSHESTQAVNETGKLSPGASVERSVKYYEGGSLGCTYNTYLKLGGFCEDFIGYGCEDCEFFNRLTTTKFQNERSVDLVHLWHGRNEGWKQHHERNKNIDISLRSQPMQERIGKLHAHLVSKYQMQPR